MCVNELCVLLVGMFWIHDVSLPPAGTLLLTASVLLNQFLAMRQVNLQVEGFTLEISMAW